MKKEEVFETLHKVFTGKENQKHTTITEYENIPAEEGLRKAYGYFEWAGKAQEDCSSDWAYWAYEGDITLAKVLIGVFEFLAEGERDFPDIPNVDGKVLMGKTSTLQYWAEGLKGEK